jgi:hypothetical protein
MKTLVLEPTSTAQWHALVSEAEAACQYKLDEELESYLVFLLMRFVGKPELAASVLALEYLSGLEAAGGVRRERLRDVGDRCLLYSGLFPQQAERRLVRIGYFVALGRTAYQQVAQSVQHGGAGFYAQLAEGFTLLRDVLQATRELHGEPAIEPLQAAELWNDTASRRAFELLRQVTDALPAPEDGSHRH